CRLGDVVIDCDTRCVFRDGVATRLEPRVFELLLYFVANPGREISRRELGERVWKGVHVVDEAIQRAVSVLRQALGDTPKQGLHIQTTAAGAYRLVSDVAALRAPSILAPTGWRNLAIAAVLGMVLGVTAAGWSASSHSVAPRAQISMGEPAPIGKAPRALR